MVPFLKDLLFHIITNTKVVLAFPVSTTLNSDSGGFQVSTIQYVKLYGSATTNFRLHVFAKSCYKYSYHCSYMSRLFLGREFEFVFFLTLDLLDLLGLVEIREFVKCKAVVHEANEESKLCHTSLANTIRSVVLSTAILVDCIRLTRAPIRSRMCGAILTDSCMMSCVTKFPTNKAAELSCSGFSNLHIALKDTTWE